MQKLWLHSLAFLSLIGHYACRESDPPDPPAPDPCEEVLSQFDSAFGINYDQAQLYLSAGEQSQLDSANQAEIIALFNSVARTLEGISAIADWVNRNFFWINAGGSMIGQLTANELWEKKELYGCHSAALMISSILRTLEYPALLVETASISWAYAYKDDPNIPFVGHVMTEVYLNGNWVLLDNGGSYIASYHPLNPYISTEGSGLYTPAPGGLFVIGKGLDSWDYGVRNSYDTWDLMTSFAADISCLEHWFLSINYEWHP